MTTYIALLRSINVGGTGKLPMADLKDMCLIDEFDVKAYRHNNTYDLRVL